VAEGAVSVIDICGGASFLVDHLLELGLRRVAVLDISGAGPEVASERLGVRANEAEWIVGDVMELEDVEALDVWPCLGGLPLPAALQRRAYKRPGASS
jgi:hypothetical protein